DCGHTLWRPRWLGLSHRRLWHDGARQRRHLCGADPVRDRRAARLQCQLSEIHRKLDLEPVLTVRTIRFFSLDRMDNLRELTSLAAKEALGCGLAAIAAIVAHGQRHGTGFAVPVRLAFCDLLVGAEGGEGYLRDEPRVRQLEHHAIIRPA